MEEKKIENESNESEIVEAPVSKFACLGIAECQQVLERLKGGNIMDSLPYAVKNLMDDFKHDKDTLKREVSDRKEELQRHRQKAVDFQISKKYAPALEAYDAYFEVLGSQIGDYEAEKLRKECRQYVEQAKKRKWQMIAAAVVALILCVVIVDQVVFRKNVTAFGDALQRKDLDAATDAAIKISWRHDTEKGISNLISFLDERNEFNQLCSNELIRASLDNYGGLEWQDVLSLVEQANANKDLPQANQQVRQAAETTQELMKDCVVLEEQERDYKAIYESCNQKDADHYAHTEWEHLQQLHDTDITQTNLNVITERYELMVEITNKVAMLMFEEKEMQPVKDKFEKLLKEEKILVQGESNYESFELEKAKEFAGKALAKEDQFEFTDARSIYTRASEHVMASQKNRIRDVEAVRRIEKARDEFNFLYQKLDIVELAQERCPDAWTELSEQKNKAESEYSKPARWNSDAEEFYKAALIKLKNIERRIEIGEEMYIAKKKFDLLYGKVNAGLAGKWFPDEWNQMRDQKKKADAAYLSEDPDQDDVRVYYDEASQKAKDLLVGISDKAKNMYVELGKTINGDNGKGGIKGNLDKLLNKYPDDSKGVQALIDKAEMEYSKTSYWESGAYNAYMHATELLLTTYKNGKKAGVIVDMIGFALDEYDEEIKALKENPDTSSGTVTNGTPNP